MSDKEELCPSAVTVKIPQFMECAVTGWFTVVEAQFLLKRIKKTNSKFLHVLSSLPADLVTKLPSTLVANSNYEELKAAVIATYEQTKPELFSKFMSDTKMTGRPLYFLQELMATASKLGVSEDLVKHKFIHALPTSIFPVIATQKSLSLQQLGSLADELFTNKETSHMVSTPSTQSRHYKHSNYDSKNKATNVVRPFYDNQRPRVYRWYIYYGERFSTCKPWCKWPE